MPKGRLQETIQDGPLAGLSIEATWDTDAELTSNARGVSTVKRFDARIGPDRNGRGYVFEVAFDQGRARATHLKISGTKPFRQIEVDVDELVRCAVWLYSTSPWTVFKVRPAGPGNWRITPASRREARLLGEGQDVAIPREVNDAFLGEVVGVYESAIAEGRSAWKAIQEHFDVSKSTVGNWVQEARRRGILTSAAPKQPKPATKKRGKK